MNILPKKVTLLRSSNGLMLKEHCDNVFIFYEDVEDCKECKSKPEKPWKSNILSRKEQPKLRRVMDVYCKRHEELRKELESKADLLQDIINSTNSTKH